MQVLHDFPAEQAGDLALRAGDIVSILQQGDEGWSEGLLNGQSGWFPSNYCSEPFYADASQIQHQQTPEPGPCRYPQGPQHDIYDPRSATQSYEQYLAEPPDND